MSEITTPVPVGTNSSQLSAGEKYDWAAKSNAAALYMATGNMRLVSETQEIPYPTLMQWKKADWWPQLIDELRLIKKAKGAAKLDKVLQLGVEVISDRLENGDFILNNKTGQVVRKPVSLRDATQVTNAMMTRQLQMEELAAKMENRDNSMADTLTLLAKEFQKWNRMGAASTINITQKPLDYVDVVSKDTDAVDD
jgi:hypothetical protein